MSVLGSIFPDQPIDPVALRESANGKLSYGKTVAALIRQNALQQANESAMHAANVAANIRQEALTPALNAMQEGTDGLNGVRASVMDQLAEPFNEAVSIGKDIGAIKNPPRKRVPKAPAAEPVADVSGPTNGQSAAVIQIPPGQLHSPVPVAPVQQPQPSGVFPPIVPPSPVSVCEPAGGCNVSGLTLIGSEPARRVQTNTAYDQLGVYCYQPIGSVDPSAQEYLWECYDCTPGCASHWALIKGSAGSVGSGVNSYVIGGPKTGYAYPCSFNQVSPFPVAYCGSSSGGLPPIYPPGPIPPTPTPPTPTPPQPPQPPTSPCPPPCPDLVLPDDIKKCLCRIADAMEKLKPAVAGAATFATGKPGKQADPEDDSEEYWQGQEGDMPFAYEGGVSDIALATLEESSSTSTQSSNGTGGNGATTSRFSVQSFSFSGSNPTPPVPVPTQVLPSLSDLAALATLDFNQPQTCSALVNVLSAFGSYKVSDLLRAAGWISPAGHITPIRNMYVANESDTSVTGAFVRAPWLIVHNVAVELVKLGDWLTTSAGNLVRCQLTPKVLRWLYELVLDISRRWLGGRIFPFTEAFELALTIACPTELPTAQEAHEAFLTGQIDAQTWECWVRAADQLPNPAKFVMQSRQERMTDEEIIRAWLRGLLYTGNADDPLEVKQQGSIDTLKQYFRQRGWLNEDYVKTKVNLAYEVPTPSDLIHMMLRHVEDESIVRTFDLYAEYEKTYKGTLKDWFQMQGVPDAVSRRLWAAHWANMPFGQLQEMLFRLRPEKYGQLKDDHGYPLAVTADQIYQALRENDVPPFWRGKLIEIKYALPRLIDTRNAFNLGFQDENQYVGILKDRGQREEDIPWLVKLAQRRKRDTLRKNDWVKEYIASSIPAATMQAGLTQDGYTPQEIKDVQQWADIKRQALSRKQCLAGLRRQYLRGRIDRDNLILSLQGLQYEPQQIAAVVTAVTCEFNSRDNSLTRAQVQKLAIKGLITPQDALARLMRLGMSQIDAALALQLSGEAARPKGKKFTLGQICDSFTMNKMGQDEAISRLELLGYSPDDAQKALDLCVSKKANKGSKKK